MTELIGTHEIPCLSDTDYAAYALYMKCLAEQVEDQLVANMEAVESVLHRPVRVWSFSYSQSQGSGTTPTPIGVQFSYNYPATFADNVMSTLNRRGWWRIGLLLRCVSSAPVVGNNRIASFAIFPANTPASLRVMTADAWALRLQDITWETNTGAGETLYTSGEVYNPGDPTVGPNDLGMRMLLTSGVENSGAETVTLTGTVWAAFLGDTPSIDI
jgi:hypothetical protein